MGLLDFLKSKKNTAETAKNRLQIIIAQERNHRGGPDYLPLMQRELLEVIKKYVNIDADAVRVDLVKDGEHDVLDISVAYRKTATSSANNGTAFARCRCCM
ncbi:cell division topological specificity factor MinE [Xanthomonas citri pv. citri]|nr:cell division topological specificity factor MinE [Xanthomonas citri pv. citri]